MKSLGQEKSEECTKSEINVQASRKPIHPIALHKNGLNGQNPLPLRVLCW